MKNMPPFLMALFCLSLLFSGGVAAQEKVIIATSSNMNPETNGSYAWAKAFQKALKKSGFKPMLYPGSALGRDDARTDLLQLNLIHVNISGNQEVSVYSPIFSGLKYPFLFDSDAHYARLFTKTDFTKRVNAEIKDRNMRLIDVVFLGGMTGFFNTRKKIEAFRDLKGLRMRASDSMQLLMMNSWDLSGTQVAWEEIAQALETGIADGYLNPPLVPLMFGHTRQIKYFTDLRLNPSSRIIVVADKWYRSLKPQRRKLFDEAVTIAHKANDEWATAVRVREFQMLRDGGVDVTEITPAAREEFIRRTRHYLEQKKLRNIHSITAKFIEQARPENEE